MLEKARSALVKFEFDCGSLNDKDWGELISWVLPEAKVDFLLKELKKKEDILAKLATLPNGWTTYLAWNRLSQSSQQQQSRLTIKRAFESKWTDFMIVTRMQFFSNGTFPTNDSKIVT